MRSFSIYLADCGCLNRYIADCGCEDQDIVEVLVTAKYNHVLDVMLSHTQCISLLLPPLFLLSCCGTSQLLTHCDCCCCSTQVGDGVFEVLSTSGDTHLGGDDFDKRIVDFLAEDFQRNEGMDLRKDRQALQRLTEAAEKAKIELSSLGQTSINLPFITATADGPKHIDATLTKAKFEELCSDLLDRVRRPVEQSLKDAKLSISDVQEVILVGGSTRIPAVQEIVRSMTGRDPNVTVNPDEVVALGAAVQAGVLAGEVSDIVLLDVTPLSLGLETLGGVMTRLIPRNTTLPTSKSEVFSTAADGQSSVEINVLQVGEGWRGGDGTLLRCA